MLLPIKTAATCAACSKLIEAGAMVSWSPGSPAIHATCELRTFETQAHETRVANWRAYKARKSFAVAPEPLPTLAFDVLVDGKAVGTILAVSTETAERFMKKRIRALAYPSSSMLLPKL